MKIILTKEDIEALVIESLKRKFIGMECNIEAWDIGYSNDAPRGLEIELREGASKVEKEISRFPYDDEPIVKDSSLYTFK